MRVCLHNTAQTPASAQVWHTAYRVPDFYTRLGIAQDPDWTPLARAADVRIVAVR